ncbi:uncharacterized protein TRAVEDRAFT_72039 [Trametes versicolor FP-101664 SS1]|uniref:uncharacterized protein n=1 Tax=Trametes versicolor (strain FP-101664) TaxID=717944 RepID=UPI000462174D|nr:uncharacterized protein TRAVEDRAFT_72039 [Trametes versicolor FP-101664 SS1]EIW58482.1 hypothetical protein TRAVEDRAFT_72039 [Trametes versicolor FP-101664 SS1]
MSSFKRARSPQRQDDSPSPSPTPSPTCKAARTSATPPPGAGEPSTSSHILCTLPPTCNPPNRPTSLEDTRDLEAHYAMYHAHVCEDQGCGCVFPDARLLELHQTECHDPLAAVRRERGEKIFACHLASCARRFSAPKTRRLHLIQAHGYPKEYFFAVTNKGVGGLLKRWGEGASLLRRPWQPRENGNGGEDDEDDDEGTETDATQVQDANGERVLSDDDEEQILLEKMPVDRPPRANTTAANGPFTSPAKGKGREAQPSEEDNTLADAMDSLSLVPSSVQFGRGAKRGGRGHVVRGGGARGAGRGAFANGGEGMPMQLDFRPPNVRGRGRGAGRGFHVPRGGGFSRGRGNGPRGFGRGAMLGGGAVRGAGPGRGVAKGNTNA